MKITTNNHARPVVYYWELSEEERKDNSWADDDDTFFYYKGNLHCLSNYMRNDGQLPKEWDGYESFSGTVVRYSDDQGYNDRHPNPEWDGYDSITYMEYVVVGWYTT